jgi:hypothetical protein
LKSGQASLDGQPPVDLQDGGYTNEAIAPSGDHTFSLTQGNAKLEFSFRADAGRIVNITPPVKAKDLDTVVIASLGARARVYASDPALKGGLNQLTPQTIPLDGLDLGEITANAELKLDDGKSPRTLPLEIGNAPTLTIWLASDPNLGTLALEVRVTGAEAVFDKRKPRSLNQGKNYFGAEPGTHTLHITRDGFDAIDRKFELKKGPPFALLIDGWKPVIRTSSLLIEGATRDAEVLIDGNARGRVNAEGVYSLNELPPGPHVIILRKADFEEKQLSRVFTVGQSVHISGAEAQLTAFGTLEFRVFPPNASITYRRADEGQARAAENVKVLHVRAGSYVVTAIADGYLPHQPEMVTVEPGKSLPIVWTLSRVDTTPPPPLPPTPTSHFQDPGAWIQDGASWAHKSPDIGWMRAKQGMFEMEFRRQTSKKGLIFVKTRRVDWVADYKDARNFVEYSFDFGSLVRQAIVNGKTLPKADNPLPSGKASGSSYTLQIEIGAEQIVIRDPQGRELDRYPRPNRTAPLGKFGFKGELVMDIKKAEER